MKRVTNKQNQTGSAMIMVVFVIALLAAVVMGILETSTTDIQVMQNHVQAVQARMVAEAGLNNAIAELRMNSSWTQGFSNKDFDGGSYTVTIDDSEIESVGTTSDGFKAKVSAGYTASVSGPPYSISLGALRINE